MEQLPDGGILRGADLQNTKTASQDSDLKGLFTSKSGKLGWFRAQDQTTQAQGADVSQSDRKAAAVAQNRILVQQHLPE